MLENRPGLARKTCSPLLAFKVFRKCEWVKKKTRIVTKKHHEKVSTEINTDSQCCRQNVCPPHHYVHMMKPNPQCDRIWVGPLGGD